MVAYCMNKYTELNITDGRYFSNGLDAVFNEGLLTKVSRGVYSLTNGITEEQAAEVTAAASKKAAKALKELTK